MPGLSKVVVLDPDVRAGRQLQFGFEREGIPAAAASADAEPLELAGDDTGLVVVGGTNGQGLELVHRTRSWLDGRGVDAPIVFAGRGVAWRDATDAGADEVVCQPAYLRDVVTIGRLLRGAPSGHRDHVVGNLLDVTGVFTLVRALTTLGRSATLTLVRGLRRGEVRFYRGEVTSAQVGVIHGQAALHQLLLWTDARFDYHHEDLVRRHQIPLSADELFADAERFLESVRASSGGLSPAMVLEQDIPRVQSFGKQIPTEVYGVLRMFDGHRALADVLEDSAYRVFETLRVAQRAVEAGLLRVTARQPPRPHWRTVLGIEEWLVGGELGGAALDSGPVAIAASGAQDTGRQRAQPAEPAAASRKRRKKKRRAETPPAVPVSAPAAAPVREIDWGALVPRIVGAEVGPLAGVVPASHVSGEIVTARDRAAGADGAGARDQPVSVEVAPEPTIVFDEQAELASPARDPEPEAAEAAEARVQAIRAVAATISVSSEPVPEAATAAVQDGVAVDTSDAITAPVAAPPAAETAADVTPATVDDEPSDGVVRNRITTAETAPIKRTPPGAPIPDDRPGDMTGEITMPRARPQALIRHSEPSILVSDLAAVHAAVSAIDGDQTATPPTADAASPAREAPVAEVRRDAEAFSDVEEAFFRAGHEKDGSAESFDDLDDGYRPVGFWDRLRGKPVRPPTSPGDPDKK